MNEKHSNFTTGFLDKVLTILLTNLHISQSIQWIRECSTYKYIRRYELKMTMIIGGGG